MSEGEVEALKARLSKLGVELGGTVVPTSPLQAADLVAAEELLKASKSTRKVPRVNRWKEPMSFDPGSPVRSPRETQQKKKQQSPIITNEYDSDASVDVSELLERCSRVEKILGGAEAAAKFGSLAEALKRSSARHQSPRRPQRQEKHPGKKQQQQQQQQEAHQRASSVPRNLSGRRAAQAQAAAMHLGAAGAASLKTSALGSVLEQYREAEALWMQDKAKLRRELVSQRKRANKFEAEYKKLQDAHVSRAVDVKSLRAALRDRDASLKHATVKLSETEEALRRCNETAAAELASLSEERDDLKALLQATLERLEAVDEVLHRADVSTAMMEQKVKALDLERLRALNEAAVARAEANTLAKSKSKLDWQSKLLERMSEMQEAGAMRAGKGKAARGVLGQGDSDSEDSDND